MAGGIAEEALSNVRTVAAFNAQPAVTDRLVCGIVLEDEIVNLRLNFKKLFWYLILFGEGYIITKRTVRT